MKTLVVDSREKLPWFSSEVKESWVDSIVVQKLDYGDYAIKGAELLCCIDRKKSVSELSTNLFSKRFERELQRMEACKRPIILCEFPFYFLEDFPRNSGVPKNKWRYLKVGPKNIIGKLNSLKESYPYIEWIHCQDRILAKDTAREILKGIKNE